MKSGRDPGTKVWNLLSLLALGFLAGIAIPARADVVFSANFEDNQMLAQTGTLLFRNEPVRRLDQTSTPDARLGNRVLVVDRETDQEFGLGFTLELAAPLDLAAAPVDFAFDYAVRRINGSSKTIYVTGWDSAGRAVFQLILGDAGSLGNGSSDRQRPGYAVQGATQILPGPGTPGPYWWGSDESDDGVFNVVKDARLSLTICATGWDLATSSQNGRGYSIEDLPTFDGLPHADLTRITMTNAVGTNFGSYWDNFRVEGTPLTASVETPASILIDLHAQGRRIDRWGYDIKELSKATGLTAEYAQTIFNEDGFDMLRIPIFGDDPRPAHPTPGTVDRSYYVDVLNGIANARAAKPDVLIFASKKLAGKQSFPLWVKDGDDDGIDDGEGIVPERYAVLLADFLRFMESEGIAVDLLGIDNEEAFNEGGITPQKHAETISALRALALQAPAVTVPKLIGTEDFNPEPDWVAELNANGWGGTADLFGTHYYNYRPRSALAAMRAAAGAKELWNTEVHWDNLNPRDEMNEAEAALATFFDCTDLGLNGFSWWSYRRVDFRGELRRALTTSTHHCRAVETTDPDGGEAALGSLITRSFLRDDTLFLWAINNHPSLDQPLLGVRLRNGSISGTAKFTRWSDLGIHDGFAPVSPSGDLELAMPHRSIILLTIPVASPVPAFRILGVAWQPGESPALLVECPDLGQPYHVQRSADLAVFAPVAGSTFTPDRSPYPLVVADFVAAPGSYLRIARGPEPGL